MDSNNSHAREGKGLRGARWAELPPAGLPHREGPVGGGGFLSGVPGGTYCPRSPSFKEQSLEPQRGAGAGVPICRCLQPRPGICCRGWVMGRCITPSEFRPSSHERHEMAQDIHHHTALPSPFPSFLRLSPPSPCVPSLPLCPSSLPSCRLWGPSASMALLLPRPIFPAALTGAELLPTEIFWSAVEGALARGSHVSDPAIWQARHWPPRPQSWQGSPRGNVCRAIGRVFQ